MITARLGRRSLAEAKLQDLRFTLLFYYWAIPKYDWRGRCERVPGVVRETLLGNPRRDTSVPGFLPDPTGWRLSASVPVECPRDGLCPSMLKRLPSSRIR